MPNSAGQTTWLDVKRAICLRLNRPNLDPAVVQFFAEERADVAAADGFWAGKTTNTPSLEDENLSTEAWIALREKQLKANKDTQRAARR